MPRFRLQVRSALLYMFLLGCSLASSAGCERECFQEGFAAGRSQGSTEGMEAGYKSGFEAGFSSARPSSAVESSSGFNLALLLSIVLGPVRVLGTLLWYSLVLIDASRTEHERIAKVLVALLSSVSLLWITHAFAFSTTSGLFDVLLVPAAASPSHRLVAGLCGGILVFGGLRALAAAKSASQDVFWSECVCIFGFSLASGVFGAFLYSLWSVPNLSGYLISDVIIGVAAASILDAIFRLHEMAETALRGTLETRSGSSAGEAPTR